MARLVRSILCKRVITDRDTNDVSYIDCVEQLAPKKLPAPLPRLFLATLWKPDDTGEAPRLRVVVKGPDGKDVADTEFPPVSIHPEHSSHRININLQGAPVRRYGEHVVRVEVRGEDAKRWRKLAEIPLHIVEPLSDDTPPVE